jgi:hypothetical protein
LTTQDHNRKVIYVLKLPKLQKLNLTPNVKGGTRLSKNITISLEKYSTWILCNILGCLIPIGIVALVGSLNNNLDLTVLFSSIMAFLFTILIISVYTYFPYALTNKTKGEEFLTFGSFILSIIIIILFVLYNVIPNMQAILNQNLPYWTTLLIVIPPVIFLNRPAIQDRIAKKKGTSVDEKFERVSEKGQQWTDQLSNGENR